MTAAIPAGEIVSGILTTAVDVATTALIVRGRDLMVFDPTLWPRARYLERVVVSIGRRVRQWLAREDRRIERWTEHRSGPGRS
jgi:hypothetical protein